MMRDDIHSKQSGRLFNFSYRCHLICFLFILFSMLGTTMSIAAELALTEMQRQWISTHPEITFTGDPNWLPYEAFDEEGNYIGIVAEHLSLIAEQTGLEFIMSPSKAWSESVIKAKQGEVDVISETDDSDLKSHLDFTIPYISNPIVIAMRLSENYVENISDISSKKIALIKDYGYASKIRKKYSDIDFITVDDIHDGLVSVSTGEVDALLCTLSLCSYTISELGMSNVKITGKTEFETRLAFGVQKNLPELVSILNTAIRSISRAQQQVIFDGWIKDKFHNRTNYPLVTQVVLLATFLLALAYIWNRRLSREIQSRIEMEKERDQSERALRDQAKIIDQIHDSVIATDLDGYITKWNKGSEVLLGYSSDEMLGKHVTAIYPEEDHDFLSQNIISPLQKNGEHEAEVNLQRKNGGLFCGHLSLTMLYDDHGNASGMIGYVMDVTQRKQAEQALKKSEERFRLINSLIPGIVYQFKVDVNGNRSMPYVSPTVEKYIGLTAQTVMNDVEKWFDLTYPDDLQSLESSIIESMENMTLWEWEGRFFKNENDIQWLFGSSTPIRNDDGSVVWSGVFIDINERKQAEVERVQVESILASLASGVTGLEFDAFISNVLQTLCEFYHSEYAFVGELKPDKKSVKTCAVWGDGKRVDDFEYSLEGTPCKNVLQQKKFLISEDVCTLYPDDKLLADMKISGYFGVRLEALDGSPLGLLSIMDTNAIEIGDRTESVLNVFATRIALELEREQANRELLQYREQLEHQVKQRTKELSKARDEAQHANQIKSNFLSRMSHELRTPLNAILGFGQMLDLDSKEFSDIQKMNVKEILEAGSHLLNLINEVLDLSKIESGKLDIKIEDVSITEVIKQCMSLLSVMIEASHLDIVDHVSDANYIVKADYIRLKQVLLNLLTNAVKYNSEYGCISLDSEVINSDRLRISVTDNGTGLNDDEVAKLFIPFERMNIENNVEGTGIGLVITKHLIELMGGKIGVKSTPNKGSTFWIELPLYDNS